MCAPLNTGVRRCVPVSCRRRYREYRSEYLTFLEEPDQKVELLDKLKQMEDGLDATAILLAREEAKIEVSVEETRTERKGGGALITHNS